MQKMFRYQFFSETQRVSPTMFFDTVRRQVFDGKLWFPLFLLSLSFFDTRNFLKYRRDHVQSFLPLWNKRFPTDFSDIPFLCKRCFDTRIFLKHRKGSLQIFSALWDKNFSVEISDMPFLCIRFFDIRLFLKQKVSPTKILGNVRQKNINRK